MWPTPTCSLPLGGGGLSRYTGVTTVTSGRCVPPWYGSLSTYTSPGCICGLRCDHRLDRFAHAAQVHRHVRRVGDQLAGGAEQRAGEVQPLLDVHRVGGVLQPQAHLLGDVHEQVVEHLQHHRVGLGADGMARDTRTHALQLQRAGARHLRLPAGLDHGGGVGLGDDRRAVDARAGTQPLAAPGRRRASRRPVRRLRSTCERARRRWRRAPRRVAPRPRRQSARRRRWLRPTPPR